MALDQKDMEFIERTIYKNGDDTAVSIARSFERLEERLDASEARLQARFSDLEDKVDGAADDLTERIGQVRGDVRELMGRTDDE